MYFRIYEASFPYVRFQVLTTAGMKFGVFWDVAPCNHVEVGRRFRGAYCLHHQGDLALMMEALKRRSTSTRLHVVTSQKTLKFFSTCLANVS
jgi:hypothetical protein